jgi:hypothetical protein
MNTHSLARPALWLLSSLSLLTGTVLAQAPGGEGAPAAGDHPKGPPPQAIEACKGKANGAVCNFTGRQNQALTGTCFAPPAGQKGEQYAAKSGDQGGPPLACRPNRVGPDGGQKKQ